MSVKIKISLLVIAKMIKFDDSKPNKETIGLLIGRQNNDYLIVDDIRISKKEGTAVHVEFKEEELIETTIEISKRNDDRVIVGWIHTHPNLTAFMSSTDINTQEIYQSLMDNAIAVVIDSVKFMKTMNIQDLDMKVFRIDNNKPISLEFEVFDNLQIGLSSYLKLDIKNLMQIQLEKLEDKSDLENNMYIDFEDEFKKMNMKNEYENLIKNKIIRRGSMRKNYAEDLIKSIQRKNEINTLITILVGIFIEIIIILSIFD